MSTNYFNVHDSEIQGIVRQCCNEVLFSAVQHSFVQCSLILYSSVHCSAIPVSGVQHVSVQWPTVQCSRVAYSAVYWAREGLSVEPGRDDLLVSVYTALHSTVLLLRCTALHCTALSFTGLHSNIPFLNWTEIHYNELSYTTLNSTVLD